MLSGRRDLKHFAGSVARIGALPSAITSGSSGPVGGSDMGANKFLGRWRIRHMAGNGVFGAAAGGA